MEQRIVVFDLETGGTDPKRHPIIQIAAIAIDDDFEKLEAFEAKVRFDRKRANAASLRKNHYHPGIWATDARPTKEVVLDFAAFLRRHATVPTLAASGRTHYLAQLVAHNAEFDRMFIEHWFKQHRVYLPARRTVLCTMQLALWHYVATGVSPPASLKLSSLCAQFGVPFHAASAHDALGDVAATAGLFEVLTKDVSASSKAPLDGIPKAFE